MAEDAGGTHMLKRMGRRMVQSTHEGDTIGPKAHILDRIPPRACKMPNGPICDDSVKHAHTVNFLRFDHQFMSIHCVPGEPRFNETVDAVSMSGGESGRTLILTPCPKTQFWLVEKISMKNYPNMAKVCKYPYCDSYCV